MMTVTTAFDNDVTFAVSLLMTICDDAISDSGVDDDRL